MISPPERAAALRVRAPRTVPRQRGFAHGGGSATKPKREREFNEEHQVLINRVPPKLRGHVAALAARSLESMKAQAAKGAAKMARLAGFLAGKRKNRRFAHGAVKQPARKEQRKEAQAMENAHKQLARSQYRQEQIAILSHAVHNGTCSDMLVPLDDDLNVGTDVSRAQATRAQIQCMVVLEFFRLLEESAQENGGELQGGSVYELAAQAGACAAPRLSCVATRNLRRRGALCCSAHTVWSAHVPRGAPAPHMRPRLGRGALKFVCDRR